MTRKLLFSIFSIILVIRVYSQGCPGPAQRTALVNLQRGNIVESSRAGQIPLTDACGNLRYAQYVEIDLTPIGFTPTSTGNTSNYSEFVTDPLGDIYYIDWQGRGLRLKEAGAGPDMDWLRISDNQISYNIRDSIYTDNYAAINMRVVWPKAQLLLGDSSSLDGGNGVVAGLRDARWGFYRFTDNSWSSIGQEGNILTARIGPGTTGFRVQSSGGSGPTSPTVPFRDIASFKTDSTIWFNDYPRTRSDTATALNFLYTDLQGVLRSKPVGSFPGIGLTASNGLTRTGDDFQLGGTLINLSSTITGGTNRLFFTSNFTDGGVNSGYEFSNPLTTASLTFGVKGTSASSNSGSAGIVGAGSSNSGGVYGNAVAGFGVFGLSSTGIGVRGQSTSGAAISGQSNSGLSGLFNVFPSSTNNIYEVVRLNRSTSGSAGNGIGASLSFNSETSDGANYESANIASTWTDITTGTRTGDFRIYTTNNATSALRATFSGSGALRLHSYGTGTFTGTAAYMLQVDINGNIIEGPASGGGGVPAGTSTQTVRYDNTNTLVATSIITNNGTEVGINAAPVTGVELYVNGNTRTDGSIVTRGAGAINTDGASTVKFINTTAVTGQTWHLLNKDDGSFALALTATEFFNANPTTGVISAPYGFVSGVKETITSGASTALGDNTWSVYVNPASVLASHTITLPANPVDQHILRIKFGGTIAANSPVVTALTIAAGAGETLYQNVTPTAANGGDTITYEFNSATSMWHRIMN